MRLEAQDEWAQLKRKNRRKKNHSEVRYRPRKQDGIYKGTPIGEDK